MILLIISKSFDVSNKLLINILSSAIQIFSNPAQDKLTIQAKASSISVVSMANLTGKLHWSGKNVTFQPSFSLDIRELPSGVYNISIQSERHILHQRFTKN